MPTEYLEQQLEKWKRILLFFWGAGLTLAASTFGTTSEYTFSGGWILAWIVLQLGTVPTGLVMLFSKDWPQLPPTQRLNVAFGFLGIGWLGWLAIGFRICAREPYTFAFILLPGAVLAAIYLLRRRMHTNSPEEIFP